MIEREMCARKLILLLWIWYEGILKVLNSLKLGQANIGIGFIQSATPLGFSLRLTSIMTAHCAHFKVTICYLSIWFISSLLIFLSEWDLWNIIQTHYHKYLTSKIALAKCQRWLHPLAGKWSPRTTNTASVSLQSRPSSIVDFSLIFPILILQLNQTKPNSIQF